MEWRLVLNLTSGFLISISTLTNFKDEGINEEDFTEHNDSRDFCIPMDFDGDGKTDLIVSDSYYKEEYTDWYDGWGLGDKETVFKKHRIFWYRSTGIGFELVNKVEYDDDNIFPKNFALGDFNGDGMSDLLCYGPDLWYGGDKTRRARIYTNQSFDAQSGKIIGITNGLKQKTKVEYSTLTDKTVYTRHGGVYPVAEIQIGFLRIFHF